MSAAASPARSGESRKTLRDEQKPREREKEKGRVREKEKRKVKKVSRGQGR